MEPRRPPVSPRGSTLLGPAQAASRSAAALSSSALFAGEPGRGPRDAPSFLAPAPAPNRQERAKAPLPPGFVKPRLTYSKELELKTTLQELLVYIIFLADLCILTFGMVNTDMYYLNKVMSNLFLETPVSETDEANFDSIGSITDFWKFAEGPLLDGLYWDTWYNNKTIPDPKNGSHIYYENLLLGVARVRQLKVRNNTCSIHPLFTTFLKECYYKYRLAAEDKSDFGPRNKPEWVYSVASSLAPWHWGSMGMYSAGGFMFTLPKSKEESIKKLAFLKENNWLTRGTRVVFIDFSVYNANINLFCVARLIVEFPATGGAVSSSQFYSVKLLRYVSSTDYFLASCEAVFCLFIFGFIIQELVQMRRIGVEYFKSAWNWLDLLLVALSIFAIAFNIYRTVEVSLLMDDLLSDAYVYPDFYFLAYWQTHYNNMIAINVFFAWIKIFKFISFNKTMTQLSSTLSRCAKDIIGFAIMFFIIFFAYAQLGYLIFGSQVDEFSTFQNCIFTQFRIVLGDFNFAVIEEANRILGPIYFITFVFFVFFVLLNMFLAIINDTYTEVKADFSVIPSQEFDVSDLIRQSCNKALVKLKLKSEMDDLCQEGGGLRNTERIHSSVSKIPDSHKPSRRSSIEEKDYLSSPQLRKWKKKLDHKYRFSEDKLPTPSQSYISPQDFQQLAKKVMDLEKQLDDVNTKLSQITKSTPEPKHSDRKLN
ncbi:PREDICTED: polycystic kidney disease 2-like 2 protein [Crocodylus porosus]|uniref:polycystic kidney disease 2-like 2 protein n=1 Tax=Crocodylus porosus TaxID=8502 RepID=UPI00093AE8C8|nr:PREDICTED: polycystic kidney disease 2-like 2 protein [Crocodylus porosus]